MPTMHVGSQRVEDHGLVPGIDQFPDHSRPDETGTAGDKNAHPGTVSSNRPPEPVDPEPDRCQRFFIIELWLPGIGSDQDEYRLTPILGAVAVDVLTEIIIDRSRERVAEFAGDPSNAPQRYANIESVDWQTPPPVRLGSMMTFVARFLGRRLAYTYDVVDLVVGERLVMRTPRTWRICSASWNASTPTVRSGEDEAA